MDGEVVILSSRMRLVNWGARFDAARDSLNSVMSTQVSGMLKSVGPNSLVCDKRSAVWELGARPTDVTSGGTLNWVDSLFLVLNRL